MKTIIIKALSILPKRSSKRIAAQFSKLFDAIGLGHTKVYCTWNYDNDKNVGFYLNSTFTVAHYSYIYGQEKTILRNSIDLLKNKKNLTILDLGANFGYLSMVWAQTFKPDVTVYSFEAHPETCAALQKSIVDNNLQHCMVANNFAVGEKDGDLELFVSYSSLKVRAVSDKETKKIKVPMISIDSFVKDIGLNKIDFIKIDVDGMEYDILKGSSETIKKFKPDMIVETNDDKRIMELLKDFGYYLYHLNFTKVKGDEIPENVVCLSNEFIQ